MITEKTINTGQANEYYGLSTDMKPSSDIPNASVFYEMDTGDIYMFSKGSGEWLSQNGSSGGGGVTPSGGGGVLTYVTDDGEGNLVADKTAGELMEVINNGGSVWFVLGDSGGDSGDEEDPIE